jgi:hypothetical protein
MTAVALTWGPLFVEPLDRDRQVTHGLQFKNRALVIGDLDEDQGQRFFRPGGGHSGHLDRCQARRHRALEASRMIISGILFSAGGLFGGRGPIGVDLRGLGVGLFDLLWGLR